ncbi:MAG: hypothetical protein HC874_26140 [Richelia sp. SL_2_1]|nr:hypothetical protein [Richelia sp. SL_2_1]
MFDLLICEAACAVETSDVKNFAIDRFTVFYDNKQIVSATASFVRLSDTGTMESIHHLTVGVKFLGTSEPEAVQLRHGQDRSNFARKFETSKYVTFQRSMSGNFLVDKP